MFADDTTLSTHTNSLDVVITSLTNDVLHVDRWCQRNHMSINTDRSNVMVISSSRNRQILQSNTEITYHDSIIKSCSTAKILGVTDNNSLSWNDHIETVMKNAIHISIFYHESNYISKLRIVNPFITHIFYLILTFVVLSGEIAHSTWRKN